MKPETRITRIRELIETADIRAKTTYPGDRSMQITKLELTDREWNEICQLANVGKPRKHHVKAIA